MDHLERQAAANGPSPLDVKPAQPHRNRVIKEPISLLPFIAAQGGLKPTPDLTHLGLNRDSRAVAPNKGPRPLLHGDGLTLDRLIEKMREAGYLPDAIPDEPDTAYHDTVLNMIDDELRGKAHHPAGEVRETRQARERDEDESRHLELQDAHHQLTDMLAEHSIPLDTVVPEDLSLAAEIMVDEGLTPDNALERAVIRNELNQEMISAEEQVTLGTKEQDDVALTSTAQGPREAVAPQGAELPEGEGPESAQAGEHPHGAGKTGDLEVWWDHELSQEERTRLIKTAYPDSLIKNVAWNDVKPEEQKKLRATWQDLETNGETPAEKREWERERAELKAIRNPDPPPATLGEYVEYAVHAMTTLTQGGPEAIRKAIADGAPNDRLLEIAARASWGGSYGGMGLERGSVEARQRVISGDSPFGKFAVKGKELARILRKIYTEEAPPAADRAPEADAATLEKWWRDDLSTFGREMVVKAAGLRPAVAKTLWHNMAPEVREKLATVRGTDDDPMLHAESPTWAEILHELPKDANGDRDLDYGFALMKEISGKKKFDDMKPSERIEMLRRLKPAGQSSQNGLWQKMQDGGSRWVGDIGERTLVADVWEAKPGQWAWKVTDGSEEIARQMSLTTEAEAKHRAIKEIDREAKNPTTLKSTNIIREAEPAEKPRRLTQDEIFKEARRRYHIGRGHNAHQANLQTAFSNGAYLDPDIGHWVGITGDTDARAGVEEAYKAGQRWAAEQKHGATEATPAGEQGVIPGAEKIGEGEQAQRKADEALKPAKAQKPADFGLFGDEAGQSDLVDRARSAPDDELSAKLKREREAMDASDKLNGERGERAAAIAEKIRAGETKFGDFTIDPPAENRFGVWESAVHGLAFNTPIPVSGIAGGSKDHFIDVHLAPYVQRILERAEHLKTAVPWDKAEPGDLLENGTRLVKKGMRTRKAATELAEKEGGRVILDGPTKFAVVKADEKQAAPEAIDKSDPLWEEKRKLLQVRNTIEKGVHPQGRPFTPDETAKWEQSAADLEREIAAKEKPSANQALADKLSKARVDLEKLGATRVGAIDYSIQEASAGGYYFRRTASGIRAEKGGGGPNRWSRDKAIQEAMEEVQSDLAAPAEEAHIQPEETAHGPGNVPDRDAGPEPEGVQAPDSVGRGGAPGGAENAGGEPAVPRGDQGDAAGQPREPATERGAGDAGEGGGATAGVPTGDERGPRPAERARRSPADDVTGENFVIEPGALDEGRSPRQKAIDNVRALELSLAIEKEGRPATRAEQADLARYVGWGGLKGAFPDGDGAFGKGFEEIGQKLKDLLPKDEYATARRSIQYAHYTAEPVVRAMWKAAERLAGPHWYGSVFEPGMGVGNFAGMMPHAAAYQGIEFDATTARIAKLLYPQHGVRHADFTKTRIPADSFDLAIGNPPFADIGIKADKDYPQGFLLHDYFFAKSIDAVRPGGVLAFISSAGTMNKIDTAAREYLADRADLLGAIRLPSDAFRKNAGTEVTTDIVFLRKRLPNEAPGDRGWVKTGELELPSAEGGTKTGAVNSYFIDHPEMVLGEQGFFDKLYKGRYAVHARKGEDFAAALDAAIEKLPADVVTADARQAGPSLDWETPEKKDGSFYLKDGRLHQTIGGAGQVVNRRGAGVEGGRTAADIERITHLIPVRDALRDVYMADFAGETAAAERARKELNRHYDAFVKKFGPINKAEIQRRRPNSIQEEAARDEAREEARYADARFDEGSFDPSRMIRAGATTSAIARARKEARAAAEQASRPWDEGSFDPDEIPDVIMEKRPNIDPFMDDQESYRLRAIEKYDEGSGRATKSPVFYENILTKERPPEIKSTNDAVLHVLNKTGRLDLPEIAKLLGKTEGETIEELGERIFHDPQARQWVMRDEYLSGNVRKKLALARAAAAKDPDLRRNVEALEAAQPPTLPPSQIHATLGMPWIPTKVVESFGTEELGLDSLRVKYVAGLAQWFVSGDIDSVSALSTWGTERRRAPALIQDVLNRQTIRITDTSRNADGSTSTVLNVEATQAANDKAMAIRERFNGWIWKDEKRAEELTKLYNEGYNNLVNREFDGTYLTTPGVSSAWSWRPHQTRVISRIILTGNTYMAHAVGAGKTSAMVGAVMEMRRLGLARKPMIAVPNHMLGQFTKEFYEQYPIAKIAVADERRFHTDRRKQFIANVAMEDLDAVIITHSAFGMIPISDSFADGVVQHELDQYRDLLANIPDDRDNRITRSRIEKQIERLEQRLSGKGNRRKDQVFTFEEMGVDFLFVDEAHLFRKLDFSTNMGNVKGISPEGSQMAWDLYVKTLYLDSVKPNRSLVLASGTPVTNTMAELFTVSRYQQRHELEERGLSKFDAWAGAFGEPVSELEQDAAGGYKAVSRFSRFVNVPELSNMVRQTMDVVTSKQLDQYVTRPKLKGGKRNLHVVEKSPGLEAYQRVLQQRMRAIQNRKGPPKKGDDIMLSVINDGRHAAIDMRLIYPDQRTDPGSKLNLMVNEAFEIWKRTKNQKFYAVKNGAYDLSKPVATGPATQMIFANLGLNRAGFNVPDYIRSEFVRRGVPKNEIAFMKDYKSHVAKTKLFNDMNEGRVRFMIGSTAKMATGVNAQRRLIAIHNQDPLWYPSDDDQRNGRGIRQGNMNPEIEIHDYATKGTYDSTMWGMMARKARFIQAFFEGDKTLRDMDDLGEASQYEQAKAVTTNDPRLIRLTELKQDLERARRRYDAFDSEQYALRERRNMARGTIKRQEEYIAGTRKDIAQRIDTTGDKFVGTVLGKTYEKRAEWGAELIKAANLLSTAANLQKRKIIGKLGGFEIVAYIHGGQMVNGTQEIFPEILLERNESRERSVSTRDPARSVEGSLRAFEGEIAEHVAEIDKAKKFLADSEGKSNIKFEGAGDIDRLADEVRALEHEIATVPAEAPPPPATDINTVSSLDELFRIGQTATEGLFRPQEFYAAMPRPPRAEPKLPPGLYSAVERLIDGAHWKKARPDQWMGLLRNKPGIKQEELKWLGLAEWLGSQPGEVTKEQVQGFLRANQIEIKEVKYGKASATNEQIDAVAKWMDTVSDYDVAPMARGLIIDGLRNNDENALRDLEHLDPPSDLLAPFHGHRTTEELEGAAPEDFKTLRAVGLEPEISPDGHVLGFIDKGAEGDDIGDIIGVGEIDADPRFTDEHVQAAAHLTNLFSPEGAAKYREYALQGGKNYREILLTLPSKPAEMGDLPARHTAAMDAVDDYLAKNPTAVPARDRELSRLSMERDHLAADMAAKQPKMFTSAHWDERNPLAHVRFDDRTGPNGEKILHVAEIQSDWHQKGRKYGYGSPDTTGWRVEYRRPTGGTLTQVPFPSLFLESARVVDDTGKHVATIDVGNDWSDEQIIREAKAGVDDESGRVPDAPFKTTWPELILKRMLRYAAENGYDRLTWDTGDTNAARYKLDKYIKEIVLQDNSSGGIGRPKMEGPFQRGMLYAFDHDGREVISKHIDDPSELPDIIGKDVAENLLAASATEGRSAGLGVRRRSLSGLDLHVGGEGMRDFYDQMLPAMAGKLVKPFGGTVGRSELLGAATPTNENLWKTGRDAIIEHAEDGGITVRDRDSAAVLGQFKANDYDKAIELADRHRLPPVSVHSIDITPAMRTGIMQKGFPVFQPKQEALTEPAGRHISQIERYVEGMIHLQTGKRIQVSFQDDIPLHGAAASAWGEGAEGRSSAGGAYVPGKQIVRLALDGMGAEEIIQLGFHEPFHAVQDILATDQEMAVLDRETPRLREIMRKHEFWGGAADTAAPIEVQAVAYQMYASDRAAGGTGAGIHIGIRQLFEKIMRFLRKIANYLRSLGFQTSEDIFRKTYSGEMAKRPSGRGRVEEIMRKEFIRSETDKLAAAFGEKVRQLREERGLAMPRTQGFPERTGAPVSSHPTAEAIKAHPDYTAAKAGDYEAALRVVRDTVRPETLAEAKKFGPDAIYLPVVAEEATGHNMLPRALAEYYAAATGATTGNGIEQITRAYHTGAPPMDRLLVRPEFGGDVQAGGRYVLVDDVTVMGSTLAELAGYIRGNGGEVAGVVTLANASRTGVMSPRPGQIREIQRRFGDAVKQLFDIDPTALTGDEATYLLNFRDADALRTRAAAAAGQRRARLASKGIEGEAAGGGVGGGPPPDEISAAMPRPPPRRPVSATPSPTIRDRIADLFASDFGTRFIENFSNLSHRVRILQNEIEARAGGPPPNRPIISEPMHSTLPDPQQFYAKKRLYPGRVGHIVGEFNKKFLNPLIAFMKTNKITKEEAGEYLYALHAEERNLELSRLHDPSTDFYKAATDSTVKGASGMSKDEADAIIARYHGGPRGGAFQDLRTRIRDLNDANLNMIERYWLETPATLRAWRDMYQDYVPLQGWEDAPDEMPRRWRVGAKFNVRGPEVRRAFGRTSKADNPLVNLLDQSYRIIERGERNRYLVSVWSALSSFAPADIKDIAVLNKGRPKREINPRTGLVVTTSDFGDRYREEAVHLKIRGESRYIVFQDKAVAEAVKRMNPYSNMVIATMLQGTNKMKSLWTHYSPEFLLRHFIGRYPIEGLLNAQELKESGDFSTWRYIKEAQPLWGEATRAILARQAGQPAGLLGQRWDEMVKTGGAMTFRSMRDTELLREHLTTLLRDVSGKPHLAFIQKWRHIVESIDYITNALDNSLRLSVYSQARDQGMTPQKAAVRARDATIDYQLRAKFSSVLGVFLPFFNTAMRTGTRLSAAMIRSPTIRAAFLAVIAANALLGVWNYLVGGNDTDGTPFFEKLPPWTRALNIIIMNPFDKDSKGRPQPIKIPLPYNWALPFNMGNLVAGAFLGKEGWGKQAHSLIKSLLMSFTPLGETENPFDIVTPEVLRAPAHILENRTWTGARLHEDERFQKAPNAYSGFRPIQGKERTGEGWKRIAEAINDASGGSRVKSGIIDFHPESYREIFDQLFGAQKRFGLKIGETAKSIAKGEQPNPMDIPLVSVFRGADYDAADRYAAGQRRYKAEHPWLR